MSVKYLELVWRDEYYGQPDKSKLLVALAIADYCNEHGFAFPSIENLARKARTRPRGVQEICRILEKDGKLEIYIGKGKNGTNLYKLTRVRLSHPDTNGSSVNGARIPQGVDAPTAGWGCVPAAEEAAEEAPLDRTQSVRNRQESSGTVNQTITPIVPTLPASPGVSEKKIQKTTLPESAEAIRIAQLFHRRLTTEWSASEIKAFKTLKFEPSDLDLIEAYYAAQRDKGEEGRHRRDLKTFLNNFPGELDRARQVQKKVIRGSV